MNRTRIAAGFATALFAVSAGATDFEYGIAVGVGTSDNIARVAFDEQSETIATAGFDLRLIREGRRVEADIDIDLTYFDYQEGTFDSEVAGVANADIRYKLVPDTFEWVFTDSFGQLSVDPFEAPTPENRENINYFTTGPDLKLRLGSFGDFTTFGRYSSTYYEESDFDDQRLLVGIALGRELSTSSNFSLIATTERVEFDEPESGSDYDRQAAFLRYEFEVARTRIRTDAGYTFLHDFESTSGDPLLEVHVTRNISERSILTLRGGVRSGDAASALRYENVLGGGTPGRPDQISSTDPFELQHVRLGWRFTAPRTEVILAVSYEKENYERQSELDNEQSFIRASAERHITPRISVRAEASFRRFEYDTASQEDDESDLGLYFSWNAVGRLYVEADVEFFKRESTAFQTEYDETRTFLRLAWRNRRGSSVTT